MTARRVLGACLVALLLAGAGALAAAGATDERPPTKLWSEFPLVPTTTSAAPSTPPVSQERQISRPSAATTAIRVVDTADDTSLFLIAGIAFGFAAAGTAFAIAVFTGVQALRRRTWIEQTGDAEAPPKRSEPPLSPAPAAAVTPPLPVTPTPPLPVTATPALPATPTLVDVLQPSGRLSPAPAGAQPDELVVALWRGYVKSRFYATAAEPDGTEITVAASPFFRPERKLPVEESVAARAAHADLARELAELGWEPVETDETFASLYRRQSSATGGHGTADPARSGRNQNA